MNRLQLIVKTPMEVVLQLAAGSVRLPTHSGQVGLRPRMEPIVLAVEPGLILVRVQDLITFVGTAGGLMKCDGKTAELVTPLAVVGEDEAEVMRQLQQRLEQPGSEMEIRRAISSIQSSILDEVRRNRSVGTGRGENWE